MHIIDILGIVVAWYGLYWHVSSRPVSTVFDTFTIFALCNEGKAIVCIKVQVELLTAKKFKLQFTVIEITCYVPYCLH